MLIQKILSKPEFYYIPFPQKTEDIYFQITLKSGCAQENEKEFGVGHLLEHYILSPIPQDINCNGNLSQEITNYYLNSNKSKILKEISIFLEHVLSPDFNNVKAFNYEKERVLNELKSKLSLLEAKMEDLLVRNRFNKNCPYGRSKFKEIKNIENKNLEDLKKYHQKFFNYGNLVFIIGGYKLEKKLLNQIAKLIKKYRLTDVNKVKYKFSCQYSKFKIIKQKEESLADDVFIVLSFPALGALSKDFKRGYEIKILNIFLSTSKYGIFEEIKKAGIYSVGYKNGIGRNGGFVSFGTIIPLSKLETFLNIFLNQLKKIKTEDVSSKILKEIKTNFQKTSKKSFSNNLERLDWIIYDLIYYKKVISLKEEIKLIKKINQKSIKNLARKILDLNYLNILLLTKNIEKLNLSQIKLLIKKYF